MALVRRSRLATTYVVYLVLDIIWLAARRSTNDTYVRGISGSGLEQTNGLAALVFYSMMPLLIFELAAKRVLLEVGQHQHPQQQQQQQQAGLQSSLAIKYGCLLGLASYGGS